jgi:hypothetical protein
MEPTKRAGNAAHGKESFGGACLELTPLEEPNLLWAKPRIQHDGVVVRRCETAAAHTEVATGPAPSAGERSVPLHWLERLLVERRMRSRGRLVKGLGREKIQRKKAIGGDKTHNARTQHCHRMNVSRALLEQQGSATGPLRQD